MNEYFYSTSTNATTTSRTPSTYASDQPEGTAIPSNEPAVFTFNSARFMVSSDPDYGHTARVPMEGQSMRIPVATVVFASTTLVAETQWEVPFCARPPEWKSALMQLVLEHFQPAEVEVEQ